MTKKLLVLVLILGVAGFLVNCKSTPEEPEEPVVQEIPEEKPEEKPEEAPQVVEEPEEAPEEKVVVAPVTDEEIRKARNAIARAREADAGYYDPATLKEAEDALNSALAARRSDPAAARQHLARSIDRANRAFDNSVVGAARELAERAERLDEELLAIHADKFLPSEYEAAVAGVPETERLFNEGKLVEAREQAYATLAGMSNLLERLRERQRWIEILKRDINQYLKEAEELDAHVRAPAQFQRANGLYLQGIEAYQSYELFESEELLGKAREEALALIQLAKSSGAQQKSKAEALMLDVMRELEDASDLTVVTDEGTLIRPEEWSGEEFIEETVEEEDQSLLSPPDFRQPAERVLIPEGALVAVLGDVAEDNLLAQAKELWKQGVIEWNDGNYSLAEEYFNESRKLIQVYKAQAVNPDYPIYVVRLIPERRDCLWRIAEYNFIYANPYKWPQIWRRNRKLIQHPDLIYPGWKLVIPPK
ncbi:MAG: LysM peptidoglycan-binding domain-containing protein [Spirochaetales bacterium]|nr:LysM peptidoglycan-binding domain-containing protein [Spirochaetales bacterium]